MKVMEFDELEEARQAEEWIVRAFGRVSLIAEQASSETLDAVKRHLTDAVTTLREWMVARDAG